MGTQILGKYTVVYIVVHSVVYTILYTVLCTVVDAVMCTVVDPVMYIAVHTVMCQYRSYVLDYMPYVHIVNSTIAYIMKSASHYTDCRYNRDNFLKT